MRFNQNDAELSFYKFYYQLLYHWIFDFNEYNVFLDYKVNRDKKRLNTLHKALNKLFGCNKVKDSEAKFVTAYEIDDISLEKVLSGPEWVKNRR